MANTQVINARQAWEYKTVLGRRFDLPISLNSAGLEGWEAVGVASLDGKDSVLVVMKRPVVRKA
jgi:hypothetical protein